MGEGLGSGASTRRMDVRFLFEEGRYGGTIWTIGLGNKDELRIDPGMDVICDWYYDEGYGNIGPHGCLNSDRVAMEFGAGGIGKEYQISITVTEDYEEERTFYPQIVLHKESLPVP